MTKKRNAIAILSSKNSWSDLENENYQRFPVEIEKQGYKSEILFYDKFFISFDKKINFYYEEKKLDLEKYKFFILMMDGAKNNYF